MGSITKIDRPKPWRARYRGPDGREHSRAFKRKVDAERWLLEQERDKYRGLFVDPALGEVTVGEWAARYMRTRQHLKPYTLAGYRSLLRNQVLPAFGEMPLNRIQPIQIREWIADLHGGGLSASRTRQAFYLLKPMLDYAVESGYLARNPAKGIDLPRLPDTEMLFLSAEELVRLSEAIRPAYSSFVLFLGYGGLRWGEAIALRRSRCHLLRSRVEVAESLAEVNGKRHFVEPKTYQRRMVKLPAFLVERMAGHLATDVGDDRRSLVFTSPTGKPLRHGWFYTRVWKPAVAEADLPEELRIHDLRHTAASLLIATGAHPKAVQAHLGHSSITVTMDRYGHLFEDELDDVAERLDSLHRQAAAAQTRHKEGQVVPLAGKQARSNRSTKPCTPVQFRTPPLLKPPVQGAFLP